MAQIKTIRTEPPTVHVYSRRDSLLTIFIIFDNKKLPAISLFYGIGSSRGLADLTLV